MQPSGNRGSPGTRCPQHIQTFKIYLENILLAFFYFVLKFLKLLRVERRVHFAVAFSRDGQLLLLAGCVVGFLCCFDLQENESPDIVFLKVQNPGGGYADEQSCKTSGTTTGSNSEAQAADTDRTPAACRALVSAPGIQRQTKQLGFHGAYGLAEEAYTESAPGSGNGEGEA